MARRVFIPCLNSERKIYNFRLGSLIGSVFMLIFVGGSLGMLWGLGGAGVGFYFGSWCSKQWYLGNTQKNIYWNLPFAKDWLGREIPESSEKEEL
jgi:hypothetical protein